MVFSFFRNPWNRVMFWATCYCCFYCKWSSIYSFRGIAIVCWGLVSICFHGVHLTTAFVEWFQTLLLGGLVSIRRYDSLHSDITYPCLIAFRVAELSRSTGKIWYPFVIPADYRKRTKQVGFYRMLYFSTGVVLSSSLQIIAGLNKQSIAEVPRDIPRGHCDENHMQIL